MTPEPSLSVVLLVGRQRERAAGALASLLDQDGIERCELLIFDADPASPAPLPGSDHASVRYLARPDRPLGGTLRTCAVHEARAPVVAFLEEHALALPGWVAGIEAVFRDPTVAAASGEVSNLNSGVGISDVVHLMSFGRWVPPVERVGEADVIVAHNAAYRRDALLALGPELEALLESEVVLQRALRRRGGRLVIDPRIGIGHLNESTTLEISHGYYLWNVAFGRTWASVEHWSRMRRALQVAGIPWWVFRRVTQMISLAPAGQRGTLLRRLPSVLVAQTAGATGIAAGCIGADPGATRRFTDYELDLDRRTSSS